MSLFKSKKLLSFFVFLFFLTIVFIIFRSLFSSYFEADEWFHFTYYFPLTKKPDGLWTALISTFINSGALSGGQHVVPIASVIYFLNTKFFGLQYVPYAFMSLLFHAINSFFVFLLIKISLKKTKKNLFFAIIGGIFFALSPASIHTWTGAAPFYGQNLLSVTFFLLCLIYFKLAFINKTKKCIYFSVIFLFLSVFTKETSAFLFLLLPLLVFFEKKVFPFKFLIKTFVITLTMFAFIRFVLPQIPSGFENVINAIVDKEIKTAYNATNIPKPSVDAGVVDLSIYKNLPAEVAFRSITFPVRMMGTLFLPRETTFSIVKLVAPIIVPIPPGGDASGQQGFIYGSGNYAVIYLVSIGLFIFCMIKIKNFIKNKQDEDARVLALGVAIVVLSALPLVAIIFSFPRWGYDFYFDSRFYYNPNVGAALIFPFLLFSVAKLISKLLRIKLIKWTAIALFSAWFIYNYYILSLTINYFINRYSSDRREVATQLTTLLPRLHEKTVFYFETDSKSAYGPVLPFQTSVPQALTLIYYDKSPLPDSFFNKTILDAKPEGYQYVDGRGFGYYISKKSLSEALLQKKFTVDDIYSFYYEAEKVKLHDTTFLTRAEIKKYLTDRKTVADWKLFEASPSATQTVRFLYPSDTEVVDMPIATTEAKIAKDLQIHNPQFTASLKIIHIAPALDSNEMLGIFGKVNNAALPITKKVVSDTYHFNNAFVTTIDATNYYMMTFDDLLVVTTLPLVDDSSLALLEKVLGSISVTK